MRLIQQGPKNAKIVIVGEAPGGVEASTGVPFSGGSGDLLNRMLERCGIRRSECFVTNVCHVQPPGNDFDWFLKPTPRTELALGLVQLRADLLAIRPNLIIALGSRPLQFLAGKTGIDKWRGSILESTLVPGLKVIGTYHPAYILRVYDYKAVAEMDLRRCAEEALCPEIKRPQREFFLDPDLDLRAKLGAEMYYTDWLSIDIECWQRDDGSWSLACVGFSDRADRAMVVPIRNPDDLAFCKWLCESPCKKVFQNGAFDVTVLGNEGVEVKNFAWDTMLGHHSIYPEAASGTDEIAALSGKKRQSAIAKGLAFQTSVYTREPFYKDDGKLWKETGDLQMFWRYNALDCAVTREIRDVQERELNEFGTMQVLNHEMALMNPLLAATKVGILVDSNEKDRLRVNIEAEILKLQANLDALAGRPINVKSTPDMRDLLYNVLKLPPKYKRDSGNLTADKTALTELAEKHDHPVLRAILAIRERRDVVERYLLPNNVGKDGRIRCSFDITGTRTGRLSSRASLDGTGTNLQNQTEEIRRIYVADPGMVFIYRDYSQAEARVVALLANEELLISLFSDPDRDVHKENAARIFNVPVSAVTKEQRYLAKRVIHASNYGMGEKRLVQIVNQDADTTGVRIDLPQAKRLLDAYFLLYPKIREVFWRNVEEELRRTRTLSTPFGRKRTFFGRWDDKLLKEAYAYIPQSTIGDLCCKALVRIVNEIPQATFLMNVHDSLLVQCKPEDAAQVSLAMEECMKISVKIGDYNVLIPTDCKVGYNWGNRVEIKNPDGTVTYDNPKGLRDYEPGESF